MLNPNIGDLAQVAESRVPLGRSATDGSVLGLGALGFEKSFNAALPSDSATYVIAKRCLDLALASIALVLLGPLLLVVALLVRLQGPGPIIYRQPRIGIRGRRFYMLKFRTMRPDRRARENEIEFNERRLTLKSGADPRVTRIGRVLRSTSLDEIPQIFNVLRGEMSIVGPRPEQPEMLKYYGTEHYQRHIVLPGLTGWWQVNSRCLRGDWVSPKEDLEGKLKDDLHYLAHRSFWFDVKIILHTVLVVVLRRGAI